MAVSWLACLTGVGIIPLAVAQNNVSAVVEEIIVSADYRQAELRDIASSISVLDAELIEKKNAQHLEDVLINAPNVNFASGASRARFYQIRGIGERGQFAEPLNPSVGVIIDGVDFSGIGNAALLYDLKQVEVLLGPQGTRYGSNALAGLINLQSNAPTEETTFGLKLETGNFRSNGIAGYVSGPATERLRYRLAAQSLKSDGFNSNQFLQSGTNQRAENLLRGKLAWDIQDDTELELTAAVIDMDNGYDAFSLDNVRDTLADEPGFDRQQATLLSGRLAFNRFRQFRVEALFGAANSDTDYGYDEDWVFTGFHPAEYSSTDQYLRKRQTRSAEIRAIASESGRLFADTTDWVFGLYSLQQEVDLERVYTFLPANFTSSYGIDRLALYGETNTQFNDRWSLSFGLRGEVFDASYADSNLLGFAPDENLFGGKLALSYRTAGDGLLYGSVSRGYKAGGFNTDGTLDADLREFDAEELVNYELGYKGSLLSERLQTRLAVFYMDRDEVQISSSVVRVRDDGSSEFIDYVGNAAAGRNYGIELSASYLATGSSSIYGSLGLLDTEYRQFVNSAGDNLSGRQQAHAPDYQFTVGFEMAINAALAVDVNVQGKDSFYFSDSHHLQSERFELVNASLSYQRGPWLLALWGRNLGDEDYLVRGFWFGNDPRDGYTPRGFTQLGEPARFGLTLDMDLPVVR